MEATRSPRHHRQILASAATGPEGEQSDLRQNSLSQNKLSRSDSVFEEALLTLERVSSSLLAHACLLENRFSILFVLRLGPGTPMRSRSELEMLS